MPEATDCIFCSIVSGRLPSYKVYEDEWVLAMLDIRPVGRGHTLVVPKQHYENIHDIPEDVMLHIYRVVKRVADAQRRAYSPAGISVAQNNGSAAGQIIFHFHTHVIPKNGADHERFVGTREDFEKIAAEIRSFLEGG